MKKEILAAASVYTQKHYINPTFNALPESVKIELKETCIIFAQKLHCLFTIGIYEDGEVYIEATAQEADYNYDDIGTGLEIKRIEKELATFFREIEVWYKIVYKGNKN